MCEGRGGEGGEERKEEKTDGGMEGERERESVGCLCAPSLLPDSLWFLSLLPPFLFPFKTTVGIWEVLCS